MEIDPQLLTPAVVLFTRVLAACALLLALYLAPWRELHAVPARQHLFFLAALSLAVLWLASFHPVGGITLHLLGMSTATLLLGGALAMLAALLAQLFLVALGQAQLDALPLAWLLTAVVPALTTLALLQLLSRLRQRNLFVFLLGLGFFGAMVTVLTVALGGLLVLALGGQAALAGEALGYVTMLPLLMFPEGFVNGAATSTLTVYFPHLVRGFDEDRFLGEP